VIPFIEENKNIRTKCFWKEESDRIIMFRVAWIDDKGKLR
jgi:glutamate dehydrogenase (NADP+)